MADRVFDRETLLDLAVNVIPMGMIVFFFFLFLLVNPFGPDTVMVVVSLGLLVVPFVILAATTYFTGRIIAEAQDTGESGTAAVITRVATGVETTDEE